VARAIGDRSVPILGVNLGTMGFLSGTARDELFPALDEIFAGRFRVETHMRLDVTVERGGEQLGRYLALNDAVIARTALSRMIDLETRADGVEVTTYHADGLIVATPTGSSAYSLSAGGPLVLPGLEAIVLTPICPHTLSQRPLVLPQGCEIEILVRERRGGEVHVTVDGQVGCELSDDNCVRVRRSPYPVQLLVPPDLNRFEVLREKLGWGAR
jgi:NAD+ kinase